MIARLSAFTVVATLLSVAGSARAFVTDFSATQRYFDSLSNGSTFQGVSNASAPTNGLGNLQTGMAVNLANFTPATSQVAWMDVPVGNLTGAAITARPARLNVWIWRTVTVANVGAASPIFADQLDLGNGAGAPLLALNISNFALASGSLTAFTFNIPLFTITPTAGSLIGVAFNWQVDNGAGMVSVAGLNTTVIGGGTQAAPATGTNFFTGVNGSYFRAANNADINGQFQGASARQVGINSGVPFAMYVPSPASGAPLALMGLLAVRRRRMS